MVTRCVCFDVAFSHLRKITDEHGAQTVDELRRHVRFGEKCELCLPFVETMLRTGQTEFEIAFDDTTDGA